VGPAAAYLALKIGPDKLERVGEGGEGGQADVFVRFLLANALHHGGQDLIGLACESLGCLRKRDKA
jgi:hypothetical protein